jgi:hypothetical protein
MKVTSQAAPPTQEDFDRLYADLREAKRLFETRDDAGRGGVIHAVEGAMNFLARLAPIDEEGLHATLMVLHNALLSLDDGKALPLLTPSKLGRGRKPDSAMRDSLKDAVIFTVDRLATTGCSQRQAIKHVVGALRKEGITSAHGPVKPRTVREWKEAIQADVGRHGEAAQTYDGLMAKFLQPKFASTQAESLRQAYLTELRDQIRRTRGAEE